MGIFSGFENRVTSNVTGAGVNVGNPMTIINAGESLDFSFDRGGLPVEDWICTLVVKQYPHSTAEISRQIPIDEFEQWSGYLTSDETTALSSRGVYRMIGVLTNLITDEEEQIPIRFQLNDSWA